MVTMLSAVTYEIDDPQLAAAEILEQLNLKEASKKNSVGILSCYLEFAESGAMKAVCDALAFDVIGCITIGNACAGEAGLMMLAVTVLTSDDTCFSTAVSANLATDVSERIDTLCAHATESLGGKADLAILMLPMLMHMGGETLTEAVSAALGDVPLFGTLPCDMTRDYSQAHVIYNGEIYISSAAILLIKGDIAPRFFNVSHVNERVQIRRAIVTKSEGNLIMEVNNMQPLAYLETLGLVAGGGLEGMDAIPIIVDRNDGTNPITRTIYLLTDEGYISCGGKVPVGSSFAVASLEYQDVVETTGAVMDEALQYAKNGILAMSCVSRQLVLGMDMLAELDIIREKCGDRMPYHVCYSGGEICPLYDQNGVAHNDFHNYSIVLCAF